MSRVGVIALALLLAVAAAPAGAQTSAIGQRISAAPDGKVRFTFAARPGICGQGTSIRHGENSRYTSGGESSEDVIYDEFCAANPVRVVLGVSGGRVTRVRTYVGGRWREPQGTVTDLGALPARAATGYLLELARRGGAAARDAIFPATLADSVTIWPDLLQLARDPGIATSTRRNALFWLSQAAGEAVTANLAGFVAADTIDRALREHAVFALSQRPKEEGVPALIQIARTHRDPAIRKRALFWLGQSRDPRALALFEEILTRR